MKYYLLIAAVAALGIVGAIWAIDVRTAKAPGQACSADAMICPDGSAVGRTGPNCEFAACPPSAATTTTGTGVVPHSSGIQGSVSLGPTCPVERNPPDPACADKPYVTTVTVSRTGSSTIVASMKSDVAGAFTFSLPPGSYMIAATGGAVLPRCTPVTVTVPSTGYVQVAVSCDTGIR